MWSEFGITWKHWTIPPFYQSVRCWCNCEGYLHFLTYGPFEHYLNTTLHFYCCWSYSSHYSNMGASLNPFYIRPSIDCTCLFLQDHRGLVPIASSHWAIGRAHPGKVASSLQDNTETHRTNLERLVNLPVMFLDCTVKPEFPERTRQAQGELKSLCSLNPEIRIQTHDFPAARQLLY